MLVSHFILFATLSQTQISERLQQVIGSMVWVKSAQVSLPRGSLTYYTSTILLI